MQSGLFYHLIVTLPIYLLMSFGLYGLFKKAGKAPWTAFVPVYNWVIWMDIIGKPKWYVVWFFIPIANFIIGIGVTLDLVRSFGKHKFRDHLGAVIVPFIYFPIIGWNKNVTYDGKWAEIAEEYKLNHKKKNEIREWLDAILFAGMAAILIRTFLLEAFMIPTTSMEGSLLAGDFLFVSKFHYGVRMPMVPLSVPFVHNTLPFSTSKKSYLDWVVLPYSRLPALTDIERYQAVVFNYPDDDRYADVPDLGKIEEISMKQNYIKRCVAIPGDSLKIIDRVLYINGSPAYVPEHVQYSYEVVDAQMMLSSKKWETMGFRFNKNDNNNNVSMVGNGLFIVHMDEEKKRKLEAIPGIKITPIIEQVTESFIKERKAFYISIMGTPDAKNLLFPKRPDLFLWSQDNFGPIYIPKKGATTPLNKQTLPFYEKIISVYEGHSLEEKGDAILIDGQIATSYTFEMDYYWMMGDNRHASLDSRYWGYVPETHIVGKPWMVLFSWEGGPRWNRFFSPVSKWEP